MQNQFPEVYTQLLANMLIIGLLVAFIAFLSLLYQKRKQQQKKELELLKSNAEKELLNIKLEIQEEIERTISMEMHDNIGQTLLLANVNMSIAQKQITTDASVQSLIKETKELLMKSMEDITSISRSMNPDRITRLGIFTAITTELENLEHKKLFDVNIINEFTNEDQTLIKPEIQMILFRIYQEVIKNIIKYAQATAVSFEVVRVNEMVKMTIKDNGVGFDLNKANNNGLGLRNINSRVSMFSGECLIDSTLGKGTSVQVIIPAFDLILKK